MGSILLLNSHIPFSHLRDGGLAAACSGGRSQSRTTASPTLRVDALAVPRRGRATRHPRSHLPAPRVCVRDERQRRPWHGPHLFQCWAEPCVAAGPVEWLALPQAASEVARRRECVRAVFSALMSLMMTTAPNIPELKQSETFAATRFSCAAPPANHKLRMCRSCSSAAVPAAGAVGLAAPGYMIDLTG